MEQLPLVAVINYVRINPQTQHFFAIVRCGGKDHNLKLLSYQGEEQLLSARADEIKGRRVRFASNHDESFVRRDATAWVFEDEWRAEGSPTAAPS